MALNDYEDKFGSDQELHSLEDHVADALLDENLVVDWERVGGLTDLDAGERTVMDLRMIGFGREAALAACATEDDKRFLQAAWKRFDRHKGAISAALKSGESQRARRLQRESEEDLELIFIETPEGKLKISFRKLVPES
jgi:predicted DNA-binding WGR domain protein